MAPTLHKTRFDWNVTTTPQKGLANKTLHYVRGKGLGGSTIVNLLTFARGSKGDYDRWAAVTNDVSWSWENMLPYMQKLERLTPSTDGHDITEQIDVPAHGSDGPLSISLPNYALLPVDDLIMKATQDIPERFPFTQDLNTGNPLGFGYNQATIDHGVRDSSSTAYIRPALARGENLDVLLNSQVLRLLVTEHVHGTPSFRTVELATGPEALVYTMTAQVEVILSCGSIETPHLLLLSGIGDPTELQRVGITPVVDLHDVGKNLQDHPLFTQPYVTAEGNPLDQYIQNETFRAEALEEWKRSRTGIMGLSLASQTGWLRLPNGSSIFNFVADPSAGPTSPHFAMIFTPTFVTADLSHGTSNGFLTVSNIVASPSSRGSISLTSPDPWVQPVIDLNMLSTDFDIFCMREAVKISREFLRLPSLAQFVVGPYGGLSDEMTDEELEEYIRVRTGTIHHMVGTASMSSWDAEGGVVNPDLSVKGAHGLRIIDASVFPFITAAHTMAPTYIVAERGASIVKNARNEKLGSPERSAQHVFAREEGPEHSEL
jgi:choline dehydrogenase